MIPKIIHVSWKDKDIINDDSELIQKGLRKLVDLNLDWELQISDDVDVDAYLQSNLPTEHYDRLKDKHIVEKTDVWRLIKMYREGGLYTDIDRLYNIPISAIYHDEIKCVLPTCLDFDFSHDFMMSEPGNPIYYNTLMLNLQRRAEGHTNVYYLGAQTYMHGILKAIGMDETKKISDVRPIIENADFIITHIEEPPIHNILYRGENISLEGHEKMKQDFYKKHNIKHWSGQW
jgi:mannosyltransferase OCH1-like enzyme